MSTYKQEIKDKSRREIWERAVVNLTSDRKNTQILKSRYITRLWDYAFDEMSQHDVFIGIKPNEYYIDSWSEFSSIHYSEKKSEELKVAYFCGPEPENDLDIMVSLGIRIENVWAIESNNNLYNSALLRAVKLYPTLKIFNGKISELIKISPNKFDIIYLDFTAPLFSKQSKPIDTINSIFVEQALSDLGIVVVNSSLPDKTDENIEFLSDYFYNHAFIESTVLNDNNDNDKKYTSFIEGAAVHGHSPENFRKIIKFNFDEAYSAFSSHYIGFFASYVQPMFRVYGSTTLKKLFFHSNDDLIKSKIKEMSSYREGIMSEENFDENAEAFSGSELYTQPEEFPFWHFMNDLKKSNTELSKYWFSQFTNKRGSLSYFDAVKFYDLLRNAKYSYKDALSKNLSDAINKILSTLPDPYGGLFCDVPMEHLWVELALNQLGGAYHINVDKHWRAKYTAKTREMYLDMFVFDKCRALYDWIPMLDLYATDLIKIERQIIIRSCMDAITKQNHHTSHYSYYGANLIGDGTKRWSHFSELSKRVQINV